MIFAGRRLSPSSARNRGAACCSHRRRPVRTLCYTGRLDFATTSGADERPRRAGSGARSSSYRAQLPHSLVK